MSAGLSVWFADLVRVIPLHAITAAFPVAFARMIVLKRRVRRGTMEAPDAHAFPRDRALRVAFISFFALMPLIVAADTILPDGRYRLTQGTDDPARHPPLFTAPPPADYRSDLNSSTVSPA